jgi:hypothetical protein
LLRSLASRAFVEPVRSCFAKREDTTMKRIVWALALAGTVLAGPVLAQPIKIGASRLRAAPVVAPVAGVTGLR